jgi:hypothetical protein
MMFSPSPVCTPGHGLQKKSPNLTFIAVDAKNSGKYEWEVPADLPAGKNYAIAIKGTDDFVNYTPLLCIDSDVEAPASAAPSSAASTKASATKTKAETKSDETKTKPPTPTMTPITPPGYLNGTTAHGQHTKNGTIVGGHSTIIKGNSTIVKGNATVTKTPTSSTKVAPTPSTTNSEEGDSTEEEDEGNAAGVVGRSSLALVACLVGAIVYLG